VAGVYIEKETGTRFVFVPYRGAAPAMQDILAGQVDLLAVQPAGALSMVRSGAIKAFAATAKTRLAAAPEIQTMDEAGLPGLQILAWFGLLAPKGTPGGIISKLNAAAMDALANPDIRKRLADLGQDIPRREQQTPHHKGE